MNDLDGTGHIYQIETEQVLQFMRLDGGLRYPGTTNEELIEVLIDRIGKLNKVLPCRENREAIIALHRALSWLEFRTKKRTEQQVESTDKPHL